MATDYLEDLLKKKLGGNNPIFSSLFGNAQRRIGMNTDANVRGIKQQNAQSGFRGIGANQINDAYRTGADALTQVNDDIMGKQLQDQNFAIQQLLGIESQKTDFMDVLGGVLGAGVGGITGGLGAGLGGSLFSSLFGNMANGGGNGGWN